MSRNYSAYFIRYTSYAPQFDQLCWSHTFEEWNSLIQLLLFSSGYVNAYMILVCEKNRLRLTTHMMLHMRELSISHSHSDLLSNRELDTCRVCHLFLDRSKDWNSLTLRSGLYIKHVSQCARHVSLWTTIKRKMKRRPLRQWPTPPRLPSHHHPTHSHHQKASSRAFVSSCSTTFGGLFCCVRMCFVRKRALHNGAPNTNAFCGSYLYICASAQWGVRSFEDVCFSSGWMTGSSWRTFSDIVPDIHI